ncbi:MAG: hypothetical protein JNM27_14285 [Leptospirales bacterium]|nr:hypothetical protein [Leptospirales bacterium]
MKQLARTGFVTVAAVGLIAGLFYYFSPHCVSGDCVNGCGVREQRDVFRYEGCFKSGKANGKGVFISVTGDSYDGDWQSGQRHGHGIYKYSNSTTYVGDWVANQREGNGVLSGQNGEVLYNGSWKNDKPIRN